MKFSRYLWYLIPSMIKCKKGCCGESQKAGKPGKLESQESWKKAGKLESQKKPLDSGHGKPEKAKAEVP